MRVVGIIPARFNSSRFLGKPLVKILGKPMVVHVAERVSIALGRENTYIATDDYRIERCAKKHGYNVVMTSVSNKTGTDRVFEASKEINADIYVNVQGDEPMVSPEDIKKIVEEKRLHPMAVINGMSDLTKDEDPSSKDIPKVLVNRENILIYASRYAIPGVKSESEALPRYKKQVCIYAFNKNELDKFGKETSKAYCEEFEDIEILRFFDLGCTVKMVNVSDQTYAVDTPEDVMKVEKAMGSFNGGQL